MPILEETFDISPAIRRTFRLTNDSFSTSPSKADADHFATLIDKGVSYFAGICLALRALAVQAIPGSDLSIMGACKEVIATSAATLKPASLARYTRTARLYLALDADVQQEATYLGLTEGQRAFREACGEVVTDALPPTDDERYDAILKSLIKLAESASSAAVASAAVATFNAGIQARNEAENAASANSGSTSDIDAQA